jgi:type I restriction enzyme S subunit
MGEVANIPQLRFPEFSNEWEESKVGKVFKVSAGGDIKTENVSQIKTDGFPYPIYANAEKAKGLYGYSNLYKSEANVVTVAGRGVNIGIAHVRLEPFYPIVRLLVLNPIKDADVKFWENQLNQLNLFVESTGVPQLTAPQISSYKVKYPSKPEQQKIAAFLTAVDNKIEQLSKKQELLGEYKKGLMQQIFSQAIRFKADDGSDFPDWEEKKLGDVSDCLDNRRQPLNGAERNQMKGDIPYYGANGIVDYVNDYIFDEELVLLAEDGGNFNDFSSKPIAQKISGKAWVNNHAHILKAKNIIATDFLFYSLVHKDIRRYIVGGSRAKLNKSDLLSIKTILPPLEEQTKIANFLSSIDNKIEQVGKQLVESKQFKKALLQQMFV